MQPGEPHESSDPRPHPEPPPPGAPEFDFPLASPAPGQREGPSLPAAARVALYLLVWFSSLVIVQMIVAAIAVIAMIAQGAPPEQLLQQPLEGLERAPLFLAATSYAGLLVTLAVTWAFRVYIDRQPFRTLGFERIPGLAAQWGLGFVIEGVHFSLIFVVGIAAGWYQILAVADLGTAVLIALVAVAIAVPAAAIEEITMRGYVLQNLEGRYGTIAAVLVNSVFFAALHSFNPNIQVGFSMLGLFVAGLYLSVAYLATRQLWFAIALHAAWNVFQGPVFGLPVSGIPFDHTILHVRAEGPAWLMGGAFGPEAGLLAVVTTTLFIFVVWRAGRSLAPRIETGVRPPAGAPRATGG